MIKRASKLALDGQPYGFRVCVPWGAYDRVDAIAPDATMPVAAGPHAMATMLAVQPQIAGWVDGFSRPLPPGRPPKVFERLHRKIVAELKRLGLHDFYPLNQPDEGRRALLRFIRRRRIETSQPGSDDEVDFEAPTALSEMIRGHFFDRGETDAHRIDVEAVLGVAMPNGGMVKRALTTMWFLCEVEAESRAILAWKLRIGRGYNNLDLTDCVAGSLPLWTRRELTIPGLEYAPGAGMPAGLQGEAGAFRVLSLALDNAKAHHALEFEEAFLRSHGGILVYGKAHQPRSRPVIEQLFSRLERGAFRELPGGFEPATRLGENRIRISNFAPEDVPIQLHLFEELLDVIVANYNATPHPALGHLSPLQFLQMQAPRAFQFAPPEREQHAADMGSVLVQLKVHGNRKRGIMPHVNYQYVRYRSTELDERWELVGKSVYARVTRHDLRTLVLLRSATTRIGVVRAASPWNRTAHDQTTRALIMQWAKQRGGLKLAGVDCAVAAYTAHLRALAPTNATAVDQLARMQQQAAQARLPAPSSHRDPPVRVPRRGWLSLDGGRDN
jgi:hypothetical protein